MIFAESKNTDQSQQSAPIVDSSTVINTANALLAISAAFSAQQTGQINQIPAILKLQSAITDTMKNASSNRLAAELASAETRSQASSEPASSDNDMEDLIYKNSPLRHYHNHYRSAFSTSLTTSNSSKQVNEQNSNDSSSSSSSSNGVSASLPPSSR